ncbi:unnamed protein product [Amaranthus hypochondriacus]
MKISVIILVFLINITITLIQASNHDNQRKPYIVYMGELSQGLKQVTVQKHHHNLLVQTIGDASIARKAKIHSYGKSFNGFVANLLPSEATAISEKSNVVSVFPNTIRKLVTTRSWDLLGMPIDLKQRNPQTESNVIIGLLDTGIYVDAPSFNDKGYGPPPLKWKGKCDKGANFTRCNRKVIGARYYDLGGEYTGIEPTPADYDGHGTHTASTAAGRTVNGASLYGLAKGTARGGVPKARLAAYKVCGSFGCSDMNLLAGFDDAIADGVNIISVSIGGYSRDLMDDVLAIGSFHAMKRGILTVCAGGNEGPDLWTVNNVSPWVFTVAATTLDRKFKTMVQLGNGKRFNGISINTFSPKKTMYPLTNGPLAYKGNPNPSTNLSQCDDATISESNVRGKIVLCLGSTLADYVIRRNKGFGTIMAVDEFTDMTSTTLIPASFVSSISGHLIDLYINTTKSPQAIIHKTRTVNTTKTPMVASFSSRGPQSTARNILKPDISAPGVDILAGYSKLVSITSEGVDNRYSVFNILSGTSMACPHVAGAAAYVKSFHPDWSAAAIKSALMTTAKPVLDNGAEDPLSSGAGFLNPVAAVHPGLVYNISANDYIRYLCREGYNGNTLALLRGGRGSNARGPPRYNCSKFKPGVGVDGLNYPSMHVHLQSSESRFSKTFYRSVTYVENGTAVYEAKVTSMPKGFSIKTFPDVLKFTRTYQRRTFKVVINGTITKDTPYNINTFLEWVDPKQRVRSPIQIYRPIV